MQNIIKLAEDQFFAEFKQDLESNQNSTTLKQKADMLLELQKTLNKPKVNKLESMPKVIVAVAGGFSSGKSSFLNNLFVNENIRLATGITPVTAIPTYITNNSEQDSISIHSIFDGSLEIKAETYKNFSHDFIEAMGFNLRDITPYVTIESDLAGYENLCFIDTPGYNPAQSNQTATDNSISAEILQQADVLLWFIGLDSNGTISTSDLDFLAHFYNNGDKSDESLNNSEDSVADNDHGDHNDDNDYDDVTDNNTPDENIASCNNTPNKTNSGKKIYIVLSKTDLKPYNEIENILNTVKQTLDDHNIAYQGISAYSSTKKQENTYDQISLFNFIKEINNLTEIELLLLNIKNYEEKANNGDLEAITKLGTLYFNGQYVEQDLEKAINWFEQGDALGDLYSSRKMAESYCLLSNSKINSLTKEELQLLNIKNYSNEAEKGDLKAIIKLGTLFFEGKYIEQNLERAIYWFKRGANLDNLYSKRKLAEIYSLSSKYKDLGEAFAWYQKLYKEGDLEVLEIMKKTIEIKNKHTE